MNNHTKILSAMLVIGLSYAGTASAAIMYNTDVTPDVIFGSGNANGGWAVDRNNDIELGLRGKLRHDPDNSYTPQNVFPDSDANGTYEFVTGGPNATTAVWSFEWSINSNLNLSDGERVGDVNYLLGFDIDPTQGLNFVSFDPIHSINPNTGTVDWDHSTGNALTGNGQGIEAGNGNSYSYSFLISALDVAQNSWKPSWFFPSFGPFDPALDATYDFFLEAYDQSTGYTDLLARTEMQIVVGDGGAAVPPVSSVPEPSTLLLFALGLLGFGFAKNKRII